LPEGLGQNVATAMSVLGRSEQASQSVSYNKNIGYIEVYMSRSSTVSLSPSPALILCISGGAALKIPVDQKARAGSLGWERDEGAGRVAPPTTWDLG